MNKIRVLQVIGSLRIGGAENVAMNICRYINKNKFQCDFLVFGDAVGAYEQEAIDLGAQIIHIPLPSKNYMKYFYNLKKIMKEGRYDVVHSHILLNNGLVLKAARNAKVKKRISHSHSTDSGRRKSYVYSIYEKIMQFFVKKYSTHYIACGIDAGNYLFGKEFFEKKGSILNNGIDINKFKYSLSVRNRIIDEFNLSNKLVIGHVGRLAEVKNHKFLLEIFVEVKKYRSDSVLLIVGDGELRSEIENKISHLLLDKDVIITGLRSDVADILQAMDIFVFPSLFEGFPVTIIEAQTSGLKCILSSSITREAKVTDLVTFMSLHKTANQWAELIIANSEYERVDRSSEMIQKGYDIQTTIKELEILYEK